MNEIRVVRENDTHCRVTVVVNGEAVYTELVLSGELEEAYVILNTLYFS